MEVEVQLSNIIWIDEKIERELNKNYKKYLNQLRELGNFKINIFTDINSAIVKIKTIEFEKTIIIVSGSLFNSFIELFEGNLNSIYIIPKIIIFTGEDENFKNPNSKYINDDFYNFGGKKDNFDEIINFIRNSIGESINIRQREGDNDDKNCIFDYVYYEEQVAFPMFYKSLIDITPKDNISLFTQQLYQKYKENKDMKELLEPIINMKKIPLQLLSKYYARAYTINSKFFSDINADLRQDKKSIYLPFIKVLYEGIKFKSLPLSRDKILYRGGKISNEELKKIDNFITKGKIIVFSRTFLSFSKDLDVAETFLKKGDTPHSNISKGLSNILFILNQDENIDYSISTHVDLQKISFYKKEKEILFFPFSCFKIERLDKPSKTLYLSYLGKDAKEFQRKIEAQESSTPISRKMTQTQIPSVPITPGINQTQIPTTISPEITQQIIKSFPHEITQPQIPFERSIPYSSEPNLFPQIPGIKFKKYILNSGLLNENKIGKIKVVKDLANEFQNHEKEIKKIPTLTVKDMNLVNHIIPETNITIIKAEENSNINLNPSLSNSVIISKQKKKNYILAIINIDKNNTNKPIRIINSFEEYKRNHSYLGVNDISRYNNENDIKNCEIEINDKYLDTSKFYYYLKFPSQGRYKIKYSFPSFLTKTDFMFADCKFIESIDFANFNSIRKINDMTYMFYGCISLKSINFANICTEHVTDMRSMFNGCESLENLDLSYFNTANVSNMSKMFFGCKSLKELNVLNFNTEKVNDMNCMFYGCSNLQHLNLSSFDTRNVKNMSRMFSGCTSLKYLNISNFNTLNTNYMYNLFNGNSALQSLDISNFNIQNIVNMDDMFYGCASLMPKNIITRVPVIRKVNYYSNSK